MNILYCSVLPLSIGVSLSERPAPPPHQRLPGTSHRKCRAPANFPSPDTQVPTRRTESTRDFDSFRPRRRARIIPPRDAMRCRSVSPPTSPAASSRDTTDAQLQLSYARHPPTSVRARERKPLARRSLLTPRT
jgi:hypothetical protein